MQEEMSKEELKAVLDRHHGSQAQAAIEMGISRQSVYGWFTFEDGSKRIETGIRRKVAELLAIEEFIASRRRQASNDTGAGAQ